ncbi:MAG: CoA-binding protein [Desulfohalobiaceae bacterium]|nr:CoA-binding protein [Desulfohalobiaceae bacterium]
MDLTPLFKPRTMAVFGVSRNNDTHPANVIFNKNNLRYPVQTFALNPGGGSLQRVPLYPSLSEIPVGIDLAVIATRAEIVETVLDDCLLNEVGAAVIISGGFAEVGNHRLQERITDMAREASFPFIGPNCLGIHCPTKFDTLFLPSERIIRPELGNLAFISQSGGILVDQMLKFAGEGIGMSAGVSIGNKALIREIDLLKYFDQDPATRVIAFYIEGFAENEGRHFVQAAQASPKPKVVLKAGKSAGGVAAASSHTASMAGDYQVFSEIMKQYSIAEARNELELTAFCESLSCFDQRSIQGRVGIISLSGGHGVLAVDTCIAHGLEVPRLLEETRETLRERLNPAIQGIASLQNPVDLTGSSIDSDFLAAADILSRCQEVDSILVLLLPYSPGTSPDIGAKLSLIQQRNDKPMVAYVPKEEKYRIIVEGFELYNVPVSSTLEGSVQMLEALKRCRKC